MKLRDRYRRLSLWNKVTRAEAGQARRSGCHTSCRRDIINCYVGVDQLNPAG